MSKKRLLKRIVVITVIILIVLVGYTVVQKCLPAPYVMQTVLSPDGRFTAYVFESNGGATSGWVYHISVLKNDKKLGKGNGNIYISYIPPNSVEWLSNNELYVDDYKSINTFKRKQSINGVKVRYHSLE